MHGQWRATSVDVLHVALNVAHLIIGEHIITSINPQVPTAQAPCWSWQIKWVLPGLRVPPWRLSWPMVGYIGRCASCGPKCCESCHRRANNHLNKPAGFHCQAPHRLHQITWVLLGRRVPPWRLAWPMLGVHPSICIVGQKGQSQSCTTF